MADTKQHVYEVDDTGGPVRLIEAGNPALALRYVTKGRFTVTRPSARRVADLHVAGVRIESTTNGDATEPEGETPANRELFAAEPGDGAEA